MRRRRLRSGPALTMIDVAKHAGVSAQTVSRALGRPDLVAAETLEKVRQAVESLGYIPNEAARNLASSRSRTVAVIIPTLASSAYAAQVVRVVEVMESRDIQVVIGNSEYSPEREENLIRSFLERRPLGFIVTGLHHTPAARELLRGSGVPVIETWDTDGEPIDTAVGFSNREVGREVGRLFLSSGRSRAAFIGGRAALDPRATGRYEGLAETFQAAGFERPVRIELSLPMSAQDGVKGLDEVLQRAPLTQAIMFSADSIAIGALLECVRRGISVPEQLAICGVGDYELAPMVTPALTSVRIFSDLMGQRAAELLLARFDGEEGHEARVNTGHQLIRRGSA